MGVLQVGHFTAGYFSRKWLTVQSFNFGLATPASATSAEFDMRNLRALYRAALGVEDLPAKGAS
jgi:hypothetical protein